MLHTVIFPIFFYITTIHMVSQIPTSEFRIPVTLTLSRSVHPTYVFKKRGGGQILCSSHYYHTPHLHYILNFFQFWSEDFGSNTTYISETSASKYLLRKELRPFNKYHLQCAQYVVCLRLRSATQSILRLAHARLGGSR